MWRFALFLALSTTPVWAAPARVLTGEHEGFTRLVVDLDDAPEWTVGRTQDGYALQIAGPAHQYDLATAFDLIGRSRIAALSADPQTGDLRIAIGCNCHVAPFEFRPGTIVLDVKDGPPPKDSVYEALVVAGLPDLAVPPSIDADRKAALATAWVDAALGKTPDPKALDISSERGESEFTPVLPLKTDSASGVSAPTVPSETASPLSPVIDPDLLPLRDTLIQEISRSAAQGVVTMDMPKTPANASSNQNVPEQSGIDIGALAGLPQVVVEGRAVTALSVDGAQCPTDVQLDIAAWGDDRPIWEQLSEARGGMVGEFDRPNPEAVAKAVKFHIFIGFGQEAIAIAQTMELNERDQALWLSLARILDEVPDDNPAFAGMQGCDSAAALWAFLAAPDPQLGGLNLPAMQRSFSAMPSGLRQLLGPRLIERLMAIGATDAVAVISNAIKRTGLHQDRGLALVTAEVTAQAGDYAAADQLLEPLLTDPGPQTAEALVAKIEGRAVRALPMTAQDLLQIETYAMERQGGPDFPPFERAHILAMALTGDFSAAFAVASSIENPDLQADLWRLLSVLGDDNSILEMAALPPGTLTPPLSAAAQAATFADRFLRLGLPDQAQIWAMGMDVPNPMLAAEIALANRDGIAALKHLEGQKGDEAKAMVVAARILTGDYQAAATDLAQAGDAQAAANALARARDWTALGTEGTDEWKTAAMTLTDLPMDAATGPLATGAALADQAQETATAVRALLASVPPVEIPEP